MFSLSISIPNHLFIFAFANWRLAICFETINGIFKRSFLRMYFLFASGESFRAKIPHASLSGRANPSYFEISAGCITSPKSINPLSSLSETYSKLPLYMSNVTSGCWLRKSRIVDARYFIELVSPPPMRISPQRRLSRDDSSNFALSCISIISSARFFSKNPFSVRTTPWLFRAKSFPPISDSNAPIRFDSAG